MAETDTKACGPPAAAKPSLLASGAICTRDERVAVGQYLKRRRKEAGWGPAALASAIGITSVTLLNYEQGKTAIRPHRLAAIAAVLEVDCDLLFAEVAAACVEASKDEKI